MQVAEIPIVFLGYTQQPFPNCIIGMPEGVIYRPSVTILCGDCDVELGHSILRRLCIQQAFMV